ncbi:MAG: Phosphodiesterase [Euryarchaeota archaeon ADurb.BinA087]|nr:MAG: Phosphodiesterase [Euryarchaeota archaeon ADurb.BinA087]HPX72887.1 metallophosphoesterase [Methanoregulaceae archaeon]HQA79949.1 metallophosphoesterase [Methanoregulaceae archaeon]
MLGDTHDHLPHLKKAVKVLNREAADLYLHTGDYISPFVIPILATLNGKVHGVIGNNDGDHVLLRQRCSETSTVTIAGSFSEFHTDGVRIALLHGHEGAILDVLIESGLYDVVVHGHSHRAGIAEKGPTLVINPGEVCGYLTGSSTCAMYDTEHREGRIIRI